MKKNDVYEKSMMHHNTLIIYNEKLIIKYKVINTKHYVRGKVIHIFHSVPKNVSLVIYI